MLIPFTHNGLEGAGSLHAVDYHTALIHYPPGVGPAFRDAGVQVRGHAFSDRLYYRAGMFEGVRGPGVATTPAPAAGSPEAMALNPPASRASPRCSASTSSAWRTSSS